MGKGVRFAFVSLLLAACAETPDATPAKLAAEKAECDARDGLWTPFPDLYPGSSRLSKDDMRRFVCRTANKLAGKACTSSADCGGFSCLAPADAPSGQPATGTCAAYDWMPEGSVALAGGLVPYPDATTEVFPRKRAMLEAFHRNREKWRSFGLRSYVVTIEETDCFCLYGPYYGPNRLTVKNGRLVSAIYLGESRDGSRRGDQLLNKDANKTTIEEMFSRLENRIQTFTENALFEIEYDPTYGFPTRVKFDRPDWEDEQSETHFSNFEPS